MIDKCVKFNKDKEARRKQSRSKTLYNLEKRLTVSRGDSIVLVVVLLQIDVCSQCIEINLDMQLLSTSSNTQNK
jgi:hypothetical protein